MGGLATIQFGSERISKEAYWDIRSLIQLYNAKVFYIQDGFTFGKETYGDMDVLCLHSAEETLAFFFKTFSHCGIFEKGRVKNGNCLSVALQIADYPTFQFDFITLTAEANNPFERWDAFVFHAMFLQSDFGALIGNVLRPYGLCYTHEGLYAEYEYRGTTERECITRDVSEFLDFIGLLGHQRAGGYGTFGPFQPFGSQTNLYTIVSKVPFITADYLGERVLNHKEKHREKSRPIFANFKKWFAENGDIERKCSIQDVHTALETKLGFKYSFFEKEVKERADKRIQVRDFFKKHLDCLMDSEKRVAFPRARNDFSDDEVLEFIRTEKSPFRELEHTVCWIDNKGYTNSFFKKTV